VDIFKSAAPGTAAPAAERSTAVTTSTGIAEMKPLTTRELLLILLIALVAIVALVLCNPDNIETPVLQQQEEPNHAF
jgi:hypothetical protein